MSIQDRIKEYRSIRGDNSVASDSYFMGTHSKNRMSKLSQGIREKYQIKKSAINPK